MQCDRSIDVIHKGLEVCSSSDALYVSLGVILAKQKQFDKAVECFEQALELNSNNMDIYYNYGLVYAEMGEYEKCIEVWQAVPIDSKDKHIIESNIARIRALEEHEKSLKQLYERR